MEPRQCFSAYMKGDVLSEIELYHALQFAVLEYGNSDAEQVQAVIQTLERELLIERRVAIV